MPIEITENNLQTILAREDRLLIDFWAEWCGPCQTMDPILHQIEREYEGKLTVAKCNVDEEPVMTMLFNIRSIPTLLFFRDGQQVDQVVGLITQRMLKKIVEEVI